jgi:hypothetical protein
MLFLGGAYFIFGLFLIWLQPSLIFDSTTFLRRFPSIISLTPTRFSLLYSLYNYSTIYLYRYRFYDMRLLSRGRLGHASLARVACSILEPMSLCARRSLVKRTLLAINYRGGGFLEI